MIQQQIKRANQIDPNSGWHSRGYLPHFDGEERLQFITYRLNGSLPRDFLTKLKFRLESKQISDIEYHREVERYLDLAEECASRTAGCQPASEIEADFPEERA